MSNSGNGGWAMKALAGTVSAIIISWMGWVSLTLVSIQQMNVESSLRLTAIESNRFTSYDALRMRAEITREIPPTWFQREVQDIKDRVIELEKSH